MKSSLTDGFISVSYMCFPLNIWSMAPSIYWPTFTTWVHKSGWRCLHAKSLQFSSVAQSCPTLRPHELQHSRPPCLSPTPRVHTDSHPLSQWCHPAISSSVVPFSSWPQSLPIRVFSNESALCMKWPKYWSFSFSIIPSKEIPGLISFRMDWVGSPCSPRDSQESSATLQFKSINSSALSFLHSPNFTSIYDHWKNHSLD